MAKTTKSAQARERKRVRREAMIVAHKQAADGMRALQAVGFSQAQLARMYDVDTATVSQWVRLQRVGEWRVGRTNFIPELRGVITAAEVRPDLDAHELKRSIDEARVWARNTAKRVREVPFASRTTREVPVIVPKKNASTLTRAATRERERAHKATAAALDRVAAVE